jgi:hypothetical protein
VFTSCLACATVGGGAPADGVRLMDDGEIVVTDASEPDWPRGGKLAFIAYNGVSNEAADAARGALISRGYRVESETHFARALDENLVRILAEEGVPAEVPAVLTPVWLEGVAACRAQSGPPPYDENPLAQRCAAELSPALLERLWILEGAAAVVTVSKAGSINQIRADGFLPGSTWRWSNTADTGDDAVAGLGKRKPYPDQRGPALTMPVKADEDTPELHAGRPWNFDPNHIGGCRAALPANLKITPDVPLSMSIARAWTKMMPHLHTLPDTACVVRAFPFIQGSRRPLGGWLLCGGLPLATAIGDGHDLDDDVANLAKGLVDELAMLACAR